MNQSLSLSLVKEGFLYNYIHTQIYSFVYTNIYDSYVDFIV